MGRLKIGLNGFGRIGRVFTRIALLRDSFDIVAINTRKTDAKAMAYTLQYDSVYHKFEKNVIAEDQSLSIGDKKITVLQNEDPSSIPWENHQVDIVIDATGAFENKEDLTKHHRGSVKKVLLTAPSKKDDMPHIVLGVNDESFDFQAADILSNCSCTTNCVAPMIKILDDNFKIVSGFVTTTHAVTQTQSLLDDNAKSKERGRAAFQNIVPSTTGAAVAVVRTLPHLEGKLDGMSIRVPVPTVSFSDITVISEHATTADEVNQKFKEAADGSMKGILGYEKEVLVSSDYIGSPYSCIFDANYTKVINGHFVKVFGWYDNEWGYASRLVDLVEKLTNHIQS